MDTDALVTDSPRPCACACGCQVEVLPEEEGADGLCPDCRVGEHPDVER